MAGYMNLEVKGLNKTFRALSSLGSYIQKKASVGMTRSTASSLARTVRKNCPVRTGTLKKSVRIKRIKQKRSKKINYIVGFTYGKNVKYDGSHAVMVEFGTGRHFIPRVKKGRAPKPVRMRIGNTIITGPIEHPGTKGKRFVTRSFEEGYRNAITLGQRTFDRSIKKYRK